MVQDILVAAAAPVKYLSYIAVILLIGILTSLLSKKLKISNILFLLLSGIVLGHIKYRGASLIEFPAIFLSSIAIITMVMIVFDASATFNIHEIDTLGARVLKLSGIFFLLTLIFLPLASRLMFKVNMWHAFVFAALMAGTDPGAIISMFGKAKTKVIEILEIESIFNTPLTVLLPFMILELSSKMTEVTSKFDVILDQFKPFIVLFIVGVGTGVLMGLIGSRIMKHYYLQSLSPVALITLALLTYILAENLGGNGVLAVTIMGLFYGNLYIKQKVNLFRFSEFFAQALEILVFVLIGLIITFPISFVFVYKTLILFAIYLVIRWVAIEITFKKEKFTWRQKLFMILNVQKGIAVAVVAFFLSTIAELATVLHLTLAFMLYSIILSTIVLIFAKKILKVKVEEQLQ